MGSSSPLLSVIVPVHDAADVLGESLAALCASDLPRAQWELVVVDDASGDESGRIAESYADTMVRIDGAARGPAHARNRGSDVARGDILVFVDADVCVHPDTLRKLLETLTVDPDLSAVFGAYDRAPRAAGLVSQYRNLLHHYVHLSQPGEADTFWAGCGAVRRAAFVDVGQFDDVRYRRPQIEDIELGYRLRERGHRILLRPDIQATHLKRWTLRGMIVNDVQQRGRPWMRLLLERPTTGTLNVASEERVLTGLMGVAILALLLAPFTATRQVVWFAAGCLLLILARNLALFRWFARERGASFAVRIVPLRLLYYVLNAAVASTELVQHYTERATGRRTGTAAPAGAAPTGTRGDAA